MLVVCHAHVLRAFRILLTDVDPANYGRAWKLKLQNCAIEWYTRRDHDATVRSHYRRRTVIALRDARRRPPPAVGRGREGAWEGRRA